MTTKVQENPFLNIQSFVGAHTNFSIEKIIEKEMGEDFIYFKGAEIPQGKLRDLFAKANFLWNKFNDAETSYQKMTQTSAWKKALIDPLMQQGLRSENVQDLFWLLGWIYTCRFAFGFQAGQSYPEELTNVIQGIEEKLSVVLSNDKALTLSLLELLNSCSYSNENEIDYVGVNGLCKWICKLYDANPSVTLSDLTNVCNRNIKSLILRGGTNCNFYIAALLCMKAEKVLVSASEKEKEDFVKAFKELGKFLTWDVSLMMKMGEFFTNLTVGNVQQTIGPMAYYFVSSYIYNIRG